MKKIVAALVVVLGLAAIAFYFGQRQIGERLFESQVATQAGIDRTAGFPDGLHAYVCGSGSPFPDARRAGPCIAVLAGERGFIFDVGSGSIRKLGAMAFPFNRLDAAFLTHLHSDHLDGMGEMMLQAWMAGGRSTPLPVYGPPGTEAVIDGFIAAYTPDRGYRIAHHGPEVARPGGFGAQSNTIAFEDAEAEARIVYQADGVTIRAIPVDHSPVDNALAFRIEYKDRAMVISGDTVRSAALAAFADGADAIFHDALNSEMVGTIGRTLAERGNTDGAKIMADIPDYHTSPEDAARVAQDANAKLLVLYHLVPAPPTVLLNEAFLGDAEALFEGQLELAEDGMRVSLPAGTDRIEIEQLL